MKKFLNVLVILSLFLVSCKMDYDVLKRESNIESISVDTSAAKKSSYVVSESFDPTGLKVIAHYTDGTTQEVDLSQVTFENFSSEKANAALPITAKYLEFTTTFEVCIKENEIVKIEVIQTPHKLHYQQNDSPEYEGLLVVGVDKLQKRRVLKEDEYAVTNFGYSNANAAGNNQLTISYNKNPEIKDFFIIFFDDWMINKVKVTEPSKKVYIKGQQKLQDIEVKVKKNNEENYVSLTSMQYSIEPGDFTLLEARKDQVVTVWVNEQSDSFKVDIVDTYVSGIEVDKEFYKNTAFFDGEEITFFNTFIFFEKLEKTDDIENVRGDKITEQFLIDNNSELKCKYNGKETNIDKNDSKIKLTGTGIQTLEFLYTFYDIKTNKNITVSSFIEIFVGKSELSSISATWNGNGYPLGVTPDNSNPDKYGVWTITGKLKNNNSITIPVESCKYEYTEDPIKKYFVDNKTEFTVKVTYTVPDSENSGNRKVYSCTFDKVSIKKPTQNGIRIEATDKYNKDKCFRDQFEYKFSDYFDVYKTYDVETSIIEDNDYLAFKNKLIVSSPSFTIIYDKSELTFGTNNKSDGIISVTSGDFMDYYNVSFASKRPQSIDVFIENDVIEEDIKKVSFKYQLNDGGTKRDITNDYITITQEINNENKEIQFSPNFKVKCFSDETFKINSIKPEDSLDCQFKGDKLKYKDGEIKTSYTLYRQYKIGSNTLKIKLDTNSYEVGKIKENTITFTEKDTTLSCTVECEEED